MWAWAGIHKALSGGWPTGNARFIAESIGSSGLRPLVAVAVPVAEIGLAVMALTPRTWRVLHIAAPAFHVGVFLVLLKVHWNSSVWPWNLSLAAVAPFLFPTGVTVIPRSRLVSVAAVVLAVHPALFYLGLSDAYLSHNLYTSNTADGAVCVSRQPNRCDYNALSTWHTLNVPLPPERRLYNGWFQKRCGPEHILRVDGIWTRLSPRHTTYIACHR